MASEDGLPQLRLGVTLGDPNGIGPELAVSIFSDARLSKLCIPVIYGSANVLQHYKKLLKAERFQYSLLKDGALPKASKVNMVDVAPEFEAIEPGSASKAAGHVAFKALEQAVADCKAGKLDALVTLPINKDSIQNEGFAFPGHTEYLANRYSVQHNLMMMVHEELRLAVATGHIPLKDVPAALSIDGIMQKLELLHASLKLDFSIAKPHIALLGLNPHAGDNGLLGREEKDLLQQVLHKCKKNEWLVVGPYPADGFFAQRTYRKFDAVMAMYHDQGLIPFKTLYGVEGVNFTAGLPLVRTSPDHGTAYDIAGKGLADPTSSLQAIYTAIDITRRRQENLALIEGALDDKELPAMFREDSEPESLEAEG